MLEGAQRHSALVRRTDLEWVVIRPPRRSNDPYSGDWRAGSLRLRPPAKMDRMDMAEVMLGQVELAEWVGKSAMVGN